MSSEENHIDCFHKNCGKEALVIQDQILLHSPGDIGCVMLPVPNICVAGTVTKTCLELSTEFKLAWGTLEHKGKHVQKVS